MIRRQSGRAARPAQSIRARTGTGQGAQAARSEAVVAVEDAAQAAEHRALAAIDSAALLAGRTRRKEVSPVEVMESTISRIEAHNAKINALVVFGFDEGRGAARAAEAAIMRGQAVGPLHGIPIAIKEISISSLVG